MDRRKAVKLIQMILQQIVVKQVVSIQNLCRPLHNL